MSLVSSHNEWDPLEEVIVGRAANARIARPDKGAVAVYYRALGARADPPGLFPERVIEETEEDLAALIATFERLSVEVRRPEPWDHAATISTTDWTTEGRYNYCPRDLFVVIGGTIVEAPMTLRSRSHETLSFKRILMDYLRSGARWLSAPRPRLADEIYNDADPLRPAILELEPVFDAANILRVGRDILYLISDTGNRCGALWLQSIVGGDYRVRAYDNLYSGPHIDTTIALVRPRLVVVNAERVGPSNLPDIFDGWDVIYLDEVVDIGSSEVKFASKWIGMNFLMVAPDLAIVDEAQAPLMRALERRRVGVIPLRLRHARTLGGGFHCVTLDVRRRGELMSYCAPRVLHGRRG